MSKSRIGIALAVTALALFSSGCYRAERLERMGHEILEACSDVRFERDISISLGGVSWGILKSIAMSVEKDDPEVRAYLRRLSKIEVVVYKVRGLSKDDVRPIGEIVRGQLGDDWTLMVKSVDKNEMAWIHYREDDGRIREMQIVAYDGEDREFVIVRLSGHLDEMMELAIEDYGGLTDKIVQRSRD